MNRWFVTLFDVSKNISNLKDKIITTLSVGVVVLIMYAFDIPCLIKSLFGFQCPGCGMTRAYVALLNLNIKQAFEFNPMFWSVPILLAMYLFDGKIFKAKWANVLLSTSVYVGFFALWIFRLVTS